MILSAAERWVDAGGSLKDYAPMTPDAVDKMLSMQLDCDGVYPSGPVCAWPKGENEVVTTVTVRSFSDETEAESYQQKLQELMGLPDSKQSGPSSPVHDTRVKASLWDMAKGVAKGAEYLIKDGKVNSEIREERLATCRACPHFIESSERCSECGCFMAAKSWLGADPKVLCPKQKWER